MLGDVLGSARPIRTPQIGKQGDVGLNAMLTRDSDIILCRQLLDRNSVQTVNFQLYGAALTTELYCDMSNNVPDGATIVNTIETAFRQQAPQLCDRVLDYACRYQIHPSQSVDDRPG